MPPSSTPLREVAQLFLKLGCTAFGGPAAHIGMMEDEVIRRRRWLSHEEFLDLLSAANLIPGPNSTELAIHLGYRRAGWPGLLVAGACFILPAALLTSAIAWAYQLYGTLPAAEAVLYGIKPAIIAIVLQALWKLGRSAVRSPLPGVLAVLSATAAALGLNELLILLFAGVAALAARGVGRQGWALPLLPAAPLGVVGAVSATPFSLGGLFLFFVKVGSVLYGSGYVLLAFLRADLVERWGWLTEAQLLDAVAVGQFTPGPVFTTATFVGFLLGGAQGAAVATVGIFLPAFLFVALSGPIVPRLRRSKAAGAFLDGVNAASLALMAVVTFQLGRAALVDLPTVLVALASAALLLRYRLNSVWLVLGGMAIGLLVHSVAH